MPFFNEQFPDPNDPRNRLNTNMAPPTNGVFVPPPPGPLNNSLGGLQPNLIPPMGQQNFNPPPQSFGNVPPPPMNQQNFTPPPIQPPPSKVNNNSVRPGLPGNDQVIDRSPQMGASVRGGMNAGMRSQNSGMPQRRPITRPSLGGMRPMNRFGVGR